MSEPEARTVDNAPDPAIPDPAIPDPAIPDPMIAAPIPTAASGRTWRVVGRIAWRRPSLLITAILAATAGVLATALIRQQDFVAHGAPQPAAAERVPDAEPAVA